MGDRKVSKASTLGIRVAASIIGPGSTGEQRQLTTFSAGVLPDTQANGVVLKRKRDKA